MRVGLMLATPLASRDQCVSSRRRKPRGCGALRRHVLDVRRDLLAEPTPIQGARAGFCVRRAERVHHGGVAAAVAGDDHARVAAVLDERRPQARVLLARLLVRVLQRVVAVVAVQRDMQEFARQADGNVIQLRELNGG